MDNRKLPPKDVVGTRSDESLGDDEQFSSRSRDGNGDCDEGGDGSEPSNLEGVAADGGGSKLTRREIEEDGDDDSSFEEDDDDNSDSASKKRAASSDAPPKRLLPRKRKAVAAASTVPSMQREMLFDWDHLSLFAEPDDVPLTRYLPIPQLDELVGWATHISQPTSVEQPNLLLDLPNAPLEPTILSFLREMTRQTFVDDADDDARPEDHVLFEAFDHSALVAVGALLEEMLTATFLPLAAEHVRRCQSLGDSAAGAGSEHTDASAWGEWTLPAAEAIQKLAPPAQMGLPTSAPPSQTAYPGAPARSLLHMPTAEQEQRHALIHWCASRGVALQTVQDHENIYSVLLQSVNPPPRQTITKHAPVPKEATNSSNRVI